MFMKMERGFMNEYVFISYKSEQKHIALKIKNILEENNISCWMAPESISGGSDYVAEITQAIKSCKEFIVILSSLSQNSKHVLKEIDSAIKRDKTVLPFVIDEFVFNDSIEYYLTNIQLYTAYLCWESALEKLIREIRYSFDSIDVKRTPDTILRDPIKINCSLPHNFEKGYLLFGRYQIKELLGIYAGNQQHYSGFDFHTKKNVLIKYIDRTVPHQEIGFGVSTAGALLQHPYIAAPIDEYSNESYFIHIEPFYEVNSLDTIISQTGPQNEADVLKWAIPICHAMIYLNDEMGYAYCYMTPQNIRIQNNGIPILFDISIAPPLNSPVGVLLIKNVAAPEYFLSNCLAKPTIDIYALGANMYYALTGKAYNEDYLLEGMDSAINNKSFSNGFKLILQKCLELHPEDRYQSFKDLLNDLENIDSLNAKKEHRNIFKKLFKKF